MRPLYTLLFLVGIQIGAISQQASQYSLYMFNKYHYNPAYAGLDNSLSVTGVFRKQWVDLEGSPTTQNVNFHMPLYILQGGIGIDVENDILGAERNTSASLSYNYWMPVSKTGILTFGISGGIVQKSLDGMKLRAPDGVYEGPTFTHNDDFIPEGLVNDIAPAFSAGVYFQSPKFELGISANNLSESTVNLGDVQDINVTLKRHYFLMAAFNLDLASNISIHPSIFAKSDINQTQMEISTIIRYNDNIFGGASFRGYNSESIDAIVFMGGFKLSENVTLAYSYDLSFSAVNSVNRGSHEILLNYNLNKAIGAGTPPKIIYNPRFL